MDVSGDPGELTVVSEVNSMVCTAIQNINRIEVQTGLLHNFICKYVPSGILPLP